MKTFRFISFSAALGVAIFSTSISFAAEPATGAKTGAAEPAATSEAIATSWDDIKTLTYEQRPEFLTGLGRLEKKIDGQIAELNAKRAKIKDDPKDWDFAMRNLVDARAYLKSLSAEVKEVRSEAWDDEKAKIQRAWQSTQDAYDKVTATTTQS